jgi:hypothetical protein
MSFQYGPPHCFESGPNGFICTKVKDHAGPHVALGGQSDEPLATWPNKKPLLPARVRSAQ